MPALRSCSRPALASGGPAVRAAGCGPPDVFVFVLEKAGSSVAGFPASWRPIPGLRGRRVATTPLLARHRRVSSDGITVVVCPTAAPLAGRYRPALSNQPAGSEAQQRPHRPHHTPEDLRRGQPSQRPVFGCSRFIRGYHHPGRVRVELPSAPSASRQHRPDGRTSERDRRVHSCTPFVARGCSPASRPKPGWDVTRRWRKNRRPTMPHPVTGRERRDLAHPDGLAAASGRAPTDEPRGCCHQRGAPDPPRRAADRVSPNRKQDAPVPSPTPSEGAIADEGEAGGEGGQRGSCCRVQTTSWMSGLGRPSPRGLPASLVAASACTPAWCGSTDRSLSSCGAFAASPGVPSSSHHLAVRAFERFHERRIESFVRPSRRAACAGPREGRAPEK